MRSGPQQQIDCIRFRSWLLIQISALAMFTELLHPSELFGASLNTTYQISGVVLSEHGHTAVAGCHITASLSGASEPLSTPRRRFQQKDNSESSPSTETDASGRFKLLIPSEGRWQIYALAQGFGRQPYLRHEDFFSAVVLTRAAPTYDLVFPLEPDSSIAGFVRDEAGEPVRNARVSLSAAESLSPDEIEGPPPGGSTTSTDDRGHYEFAGLAPGEYKVGVQAEAWYAASVRGRRTQNNTAPSAESPLDVVYPETWFPGVTERQAAEVFRVRNGDVREADFDLVPSPATHLHIGAPQALAGAGMRGQMSPQVERVSARGIPSLDTLVQLDPQGQMDVDGLSPGLYRVTMRGPNGSQTPVFVRVPKGAQRNLDLSAAIPAAEVSFHADTGVDLDRVRIILTDVENGASFSSFAGADLQRRRYPGAPPSAAGDRTLEIPPGRYRVTLAGDTDLYLTGISSNNVPVEGRAVTLNSGTTTLTLKLKRGRSTVDGTVLSSNKPLVGAMVMLVPASFGLPGSVTVLRRDQTNTDGSFLLQEVIPGDYILLAIAEGWTVNWRDPSTLQRYLLHGIPLSVQPGAQVKQELAAQSP